MITFFKTKKVIFNTTRTICRYKSIELPIPKVFLNIFRICLIVVLCLNQEMVIANDTIQFDISSMLNSRPVMTYTSGKLVTYRNGNGFEGTFGSLMTRFAANKAGISNPHALPDSAIIIDPSIPKIKFYYSNYDDSGNQVFQRTDTGYFSIPVPQRKYSKILLTLTGGYSKLIVNLNYTDNTISANTYITHDASNACVNSSSKYCIITDLDMYSSAFARVETGGHSISGMLLSPNTSKTLKSITIHKVIDPTYTVLSTIMLWGACGVAVDLTNVEDESLVNSDFKAVKILNVSNSGIKFLNLPPETSINIYSLIGEKIYVNEKINNNELIWYNQRKVSPGLYCCKLSNKQRSKTFKILVP